MRGLPILEQRQKSERQLYEERMQALWEEAPLEKFDPQSSAKGKLRIADTLELLKHHVQIKGSRILDLGCGTGLFATLLAQQGGELTVADVSEKALKYCTHPNLTCHRVCVPYLPFPDAHFDGLVFTDVIAEIEPALYRLTLSELSRLLKRKGWLVCSTPLDLYSQDAREKFIQLIETEFEIIASKKRYHRLHFYLTRWVDAPMRWVRAGQKNEYRIRELEKRQSWRYLWFYCNSTKAFSFFWRPAALLLHPLQRLLKRSQRLLLFAERFSEILWGSSALTHIIVIARKRGI
jgi:ubiquinone/menaquinone biosynthesis C-methylase UbiE